MSQNEKQYRHDIDGLRALAVVPVILYHISPAWLRGGFLGVDIFFVISGYLIASIIVRECAEGAFSFRDFYRRRARRIVPVFSAMIVAIVAFVYLATPRYLFGEVARNALGAAFCVSNILFGTSGGGYWTQDINASPLLHTWSLSVEEQFYIFLPILLILLHRRWSRMILPILCLLSLLSFGVLCLFYSRFNDATFFLMPARAWELGAGVLLAYLARSGGIPTLRRGSQLPSLVGLVLILGSYQLIGFYGTATPKNAVAVLGAVLVIAFPATGWVNVLLTNPAMTFVGRISYSLYMWHWPVIVLGRYVALESTTALLAVILGTSLISYYCVEKPLRSPRRPLTPVFALFALAVLSGLWLLTRNPSYPADGFAQAVWRGDSYDCNPRFKPHQTTDPVFLNVGGLEGRPVDPNAYLNGGVIKRYSETNAEPRVVLLGDSHAAMWASLVDRIAQTNRATISFYLMNGIDPRFSAQSGDQRGKLTAREKRNYDEKRLEWLAKWRPKVIVFVARWELIHDTTAERTVEQLAQFADRVILVSQPPALPCGDVNLVQHLCWLGVKPGPGYQVFPGTRSASEEKAYAQGNEFVRNVASTGGKVGLVVVDDLYRESDGRVRVLDGGNPLYLDDDHLSEYGAAKAADRLGAAIQSALAH